MCVCTCPQDTKLKLYIYISSTAQAQQERVQQLSSELSGGRPLDELVNEKVQEPGVKGNMHDMYYNMYMEI